MAEAILAIILVLDAVTLALAVLKAPYPGIVPLGSPTAYKNIYIHVPISIASYVVYTLALVGAVIYLAREDSRFERLAHTAAVVGTVFGAATLVTGSIWAMESWGSPWNWDPRETGVLFMWLAFLLYFAVRSGVKDPDLAPRLSMVYLIAAYVTIPLSFALPYLTYSLHPTVPHTAGFIRQVKGLAALFPVRMVLVAGTAVAAAVTLARKGFFGRKALATALLLLLTGVGVTAASYRAFIHPPPLHSLVEGEAVSFTGTVEGGEYANGVLRLSVLSGDRVVEVVYRGEPPLNPPVVSYGGERHVTLENHYVEVEGVVREGVVEASRLSVLIYWGVPVNALIYSLSIFMIVLGGGRLVGREAKRGGVSP